MATERWSPGQPDERSQEVRTELLRRVIELQESMKDNSRITAEIHQAMFGLPGQEYMGFVPRTELRLDGLEKRFWAAAIGTIGALLGTAWQLLRRL